MIDPVQLLNRGHTGKLLRLAQHRSARLREGTD
jgi:hypothetical protein